MLIGVIAKIRNGRLLKFRTKEGLSQVAAADIAGVCHAVWCAVERMKFKRIGWSSIRKIAEVVGCEPLDICPESLKGVDCDSTRTAFREADNEHILAYETSKRLALPDPSEVVENMDWLAMAKGRMSVALKHLTYREREIVKLRYPLDPHVPSYTQVDVAGIFKVSVERIRQVESKALAKLKNLLAIQFHPDLGEIPAKSEATRMVASL